MQTASALDAPDITAWHGNQIILNQKAVDAIGKQLKPYGELLPLVCEGKPYWMLHVTSALTIDQIDTSESDLTSDISGFIEITKLTPKPTFDGMILKTEYNNYTNNIYCTNEFKVLVESHDLRGLVFSKDMTSDPI